MAKLPVLKGTEVLSVLLKSGFYADHQKGSHARLLHRTRSELKVTVAVHPRDLPEKTLKSILKQADIAEDAFVSLLRGG